MGTAQLRYGPARCSSCKPARLPVPQQVVRLCRSADPHLSRITVLPPAYRLRDPGISRESELFSLSSRRRILALVTNVPHYAEARRSRVPCQPKPSGCFQPMGRSRQGSAAAAVPAYPAAKLLCQGSAATVAIMIPQFKVRGLSLLGQVAACPHLMPFAKGPPSSEPALASMPSFSPFAKGAVPFGSRFNLRRYQHVATTFEVIVMRGN